jgi:ABC-2 type transport system permease protein
VRKVLLLALNDVRLTARDRASFFWMLLMPLVMMWLFGQAGGGGAGAPKFSLTVVDRNGGWIARAFVAELAAGNVELSELSPAQAAASPKRVRTLVLPEGFTAKILSGEQQRLRLEKEKGASDDYSRAAEVHILRAITRTLALLVEMRETGAISSATPGEEFGRLRDRPPLVRLEVSTAGQGQAVPSGRAQSVPGILTMIVLMMTVIYGGVFLTIEKRDGMIRRQISLPVGRAGLFAGKLLGRLLVAGLEILLLVAAGRFIFHVSFGRSLPGLALLLFSYAFAVAGLATLLGAVLRTPEQATAIGWIASMIMAAMGGCWWPAEIVPRWLWRAAHVFPTAWAMDAFHALISFGKGIDAVILPSAALLAFGLLFSLLGARYLSAASA